MGKTSILNNKRRAAYRQVRNYVWHRLHKTNYGLSIKEAVRLFAQDNNLTITCKANKWIVDLYILGENEYIKRMDSGFYSTPEWRQLREEVINKYGNVCMKCGAECESIHVDHIKPRSKFRELELYFDNLQVLCGLCNLIKSNRNEIDYRTSYRVTGINNDFGYDLKGLERGAGYKATMMPRTNMDACKAADSL